MSTMWRYRALRGAAALLALMLVTTAFVATPMRSLADDLLNRFSVEEFEAVTIRMEDLSEFQTTLLLSAFGADYERLMTAAEDLAEIETTFNYESPKGDLTELDSEDDARAAFGEFKAPSDLSAGFNTSPEILMSNGGSASVTVDTASANAIVEELGLPIESLPDATEMPEMVFELDVPSALVMHYQSEAGGQLAVVQMESPTFVSPEGLDMDALRGDFLRLPGLPDDFVEQLESIDDWRSTLVVPVPEGAETRNVSVQDEGGLLIEAGSFDGNDWGVDIGIDGELSVVMWKDDGTLYVVAGTLSGSEILEVANSLD